MSDDSLDDEMPEFGKEDRLPLVVPDSGPDEFDPDIEVPGAVPCASQCKGITNEGKRCSNWVALPLEFCRRHDPTPEEFMKLLMERLESFVDNCRNCGPASSEEIFTIAAASKAFASLWEHRSVTKAAEKQVKVLEYKLVEPDARATG